MIKNATPLSSMPSTCVHCQVPLKLVLHQLLKSKSCFSEMGSKSNNWNTVEPRLTDMDADCMSSLLIANLGITKKALKIEHRSVNMY